MILKKIINSIAFRLSVLIAAAIAATTIATGEMILRDEKKTLEYEVQSKARYLAVLMSHSLSKLVLSGNGPAISSLLNVSIKSRENIIVYASVYDSKGENLATVSRDENYNYRITPLKLEDALKNTRIIEDTKLPIYHLSTPIRADGPESIGYLRLCVTKGPLYNTLNSTRQKLYLLGAGIIFIGVMLALGMARRLLRPVLILNDGVKMIGEGELGLELPVVGTGEIRELSLSFNSMSLKLKQLISKMESAQENLIRTEKLYAIGEFSAGIAHEIKNPLTSIKMLLQTAQRKKEVLTGDDMIVIEEEINRISKIITEFLGFTRPEKNEKTDLSISDIIDEVITVTQPMMDRSEIKLLRTYSKALPKIRGNLDGLRQVFLNIVLNAIQAIDGGKRTIEIGTSLNNDMLSVIISDTGAGIPAGDLKNIFDPFFTTKKKGTGMGLTLTHNIVSDHFGMIHVDSTPGNGTTVTVALPL